MWFLQETLERYKPQAQTVIFSILFTQGTLSARLLNLTFSHHGQIQLTPLYPMSGISIACIYSMYVYTSTYRCQIYMVHHADKPQSVLGEGGGGESEKALILYLFFCNLVCTSTAKPPSNSVPSLECHINVSSVF